MDLSNLEVGNCAIITEVQGKGTLRIRLLEMGILPGAEIKLVKKAPLGDPLEILIRGYELSLRKQEAQLIKVSVIQK